MRQKEGIGMLLTDRQTVRFEWLDTVRVLAAALVLISHFCYYFSFERLHFINNYFAGSTGRIGVCLFFAISGYLVSHSLEKIIISFAFTGSSLFTSYSRIFLLIWLYHFYLCCSLLCDLIF